MNSAAIQLPQQVQIYLQRFELRRTWQRVVRRAGLAVLLTAVWGLAWCIVDRMIALPAGVRVVVLGIDLAASLVIVGRGILPLISRLDPVRVARDVERREPRWGERLVTVTSRTLGPKRLVGSAELLDALAAEVASEAESRDPRKLLPWKAVMRPWAASAVIAGVGLMLAALVPAMDLPRLVQRFVTPLAHVAPAATTRLSVMPGDIKIPAGEPLRVRASAQRLDEGGLTLHLRAAANRSAEWTEQTMSAGPDGIFEARVSSLERDVEYFVTGGDARSDVFRATVLRRPAVLGFRCTIANPPHLKLPPRALASKDGMIEAAAGSNVTMEIDASESLASATIDLGGQVIAMDATQRPNVRRASLVVRDDQPMRIHMTSDAGVEGEFIGGRVRAVLDRAPLVTLEFVEAKNAAMKLKYQAADDFGLARLDAEVETEDSQQHAVAIPLTGDQREQRGVLELDPSAFGAARGDELNVRLRGEDRGGQFALSSPLRIRVSSVTRARAGASPPTSLPQAGDSSQGLDVAGFREAVSAYFHAIAPRRK